MIANDHVNFDLRAGEIHALLGENGAGKSTLMTVLAGLYRPDAGSILVRGEPVSFRSPRDAIALGLGMLLGQLTGLLMTWTRSFLDLQPGEQLPIALTPDAWQRAWQMLALLLLGCLLPAFGVARYTIVSFKSERARMTRKPFWQRFYLDFLLLIPPAYGIYQLGRTGGLPLSLGRSAGGIAQGANPLDNPLLLVVPMLFCFALGLIAVRLIPLLLELLARLSARPSWVAPLIALRALARQPGTYRGPLLLLILTLSLASFSASTWLAAASKTLASVVCRSGAKSRPSLAPRSSCFLAPESKCVNRRTVCGFSASASASSSR